MLPHFDEFFEYLRCIRRAPLNFGDRILCYLEMLRWLKDNNKRFGGDLLYVFKRFVKRMLQMHGRPSEARKFLIQFGELMRNAYSVDWR